MPWGTHMLRHTGIFCPNGSVFHQISLDKGPILVKKTLGEGPIWKLPKKMVKSAIFESEKLLEMGPNLPKKMVKSATFEGEKSLEMDMGFRPWTIHPVKKLYEYPQGFML